MFGVGIRLTIGGALVCLVLAGCSVAGPGATVTVTAPAASAAVSPAASSATASPIPTTTLTPAPQPETAKAAAAAFKTWTKQYNERQWSRHYETLVEAQRLVITAKRYAKCRNKSDHLTFSWIRTVSTKRNVKVRIPGTSQTATATKVVAKMQVMGLTLNVDAHMFYQDGAWHWSMTRENLANCDKIT